MTKDLGERVMTAARSVKDPCSVFNQTSLSLDELGMLDSVAVSSGGVVDIRLLLDDPTCIFFFEIHRMLQEAVQAVAGVTEVRIGINSEDLWTEERLSDGGRQRLEQSRQERREALDRRSVVGWPLPLVEVRGGRPASNAVAGGGG